MTSRRLFVGDDDKRGVVGWTKTSLQAGEFSRAEDSTGTAPPRTNRTG